MGKWNLVLTNCVKVYFYIFILMCGVMVALVLWNNWFSLQRYQTKELLSSYDYIVVGGGTAGCVLAAHLSEHPNKTVLLIEAGKQFHWLSTIPLASPFLQGSENDWAFVTRPQSHSSYGLFNQQSSWPRGKGLGGSGQMNYLIHFAGSAHDFSSWERHGVVGWGHDDLKHYMDEILGHNNLDFTACSNNYKDILLAVGTEYCRKKKGKIRVSRNAESALGRAFIAAGFELGMDFTHVESTVHKGKRWTGLDGFLRPALHRKNLHILLEAHVDKILWHEWKFQALGVQVKSEDSQKLIIRTSGEIILSAGAIGTPQILMRSGVGPQTLLKRLKIPIVADLPVGLNLHDHLNFPLYVSIKEPVSTTISKILHPIQLWDYMVNAKGLLASSGIVGLGRGLENAGLVLFGMGSTDETLLRAIANYKPETFQALFPFSKSWKQEGVVFLSTCLQPTSRGRLFVTSTNSSSMPIIDPQYLTQPHDVKCMINALKLAIEVSSTTAFKKLGAQVHLPSFKECNFLETSVQDENYLECIVRTAAITGYHPGGTCKMGDSSDGSSVVDSMLRVHGLQGVRVMDASVLPTPISGHPNSVLLAMASKASQMILYPSLSHSPLAG